MRFGIMAGTTGTESPDDFVAEAKAAAGAGASSYWMPQAFGLDALGILGWVGREVPDIAVGSAVMPTWTRHPLVMAQGALSAAGLAGGRFTLGIGLSHRLVIEDMLGIPWDRPVRHLREYLDVLMPLLEDKQVAYKGETISCQFQIAANVAAPAVLVAALGEQMLRLAGSRTSGTITWMTGPKTLAGHTVPILREAAGKAGRAEPVVVAGFPLCVTADADAARARAAKSYAVYGTLPSYRAMLEREGAAGPEDVALAGDESAVTERLAEIEAAGATEIMVSLFGRPEEKDRSRALLASLARRST